MQWNVLSVQLWKVFASCYVDCIALHRMWITDGCSPHLLHRGPEDPVSRWECVVCVRPIRNLVIRLR